MNDQIHNDPETRLEDAVIPVRSESQAMDWSLVLASQGIVAVIQTIPETGGWELHVPRGDYGKAARALRLYRLENRARAWRSPEPWTGLLFDWRAVAWVILWILFYGLQVTRSEAFAQAGMMNSQAVVGGEWWRLFTAVMLHGSIPHLAANATTGLLLLGLAMGSYGAGWAVLASLLAGAAGNLAGLFLYDNHYLGLGASGMVMGALGLLTAQSLSALREGGGSQKLVRRGLLGGFFLLILLGMNPQSDIIAHVGGFLGGIVLGVLLLTLPHGVLHKPWFNRMAELLSAGLILVCWWCALRT